MKITSSIFYKDDEDLVNKMKQLHFVGESGSNQEVRSFHQLQFNESVIIRMKHSSYAYSESNEDCACKITFKFLDKKKREIIRFSVIPGAAEFQLACAKQDIDHITFPDNNYEKYYEFIIVFSSIGIMLYYMQDFYLKSTRCVNGITKFQHTAINTKDFEAMLEVGSEKSRIPDNWHIVKHVPIDHRIVIKYYPNVKTIFSVRLTDRNGITAFTVTMSYRNGIGILLEKGKRNIWCIVPGHHLSPYDIQQAILDSTNKEMIAYAYYVIVN